MAYITYSNTDVKYKITRDLSTTKETYCSKIFLQAYYSAKNDELPKAKYIILPYNLASKIDGLKLNIHYKMIKK